MKQLKCPCCGLAGNESLFEPNWTVELYSLLHSVQGLCVNKDFYLMNWDEKRRLLNTLRRIKAENDRQG